MKNPIVANSMSVFDLTETATGATRRVIITYGKSGYCPAYAFDGYSDRVIGKAGGCGYDKTHTALGNAISHILLLKGTAKVGYEGGAGFQAVADHLPAGYTLKKII